jgi:hypothetical protein
MANNEQEIIEESISIDGEVTVEGLEESLTLQQQTELNTQVLHNVLEELIQINKTLKKIYNPE